MKLSDVLSPMTPEQLHHAVLENPDLVRTRQETQARAKVIVERFPEFVAAAE